MGALSQRLQTLASGVAHACEGGARLSAHDAAALHADLLACATEAYRLERETERLAYLERVRAPADAGLQPGLAEKVWR